ncbi:MAG: hypothetical protein IPL65_08070 [Lewinellaceae bacterium]|nr:hypothetical protein [Lewinellaceae bacterium]
MRTLYTAVVLLLCAGTLQACDVCGCSVGGQYAGILPQFHRNFIGTRISGQTFRTAHSAWALANDYEVSEEVVYSIDLLARMYVGRRIQILGVVPYLNFQRNGEGSTANTSGFGDVAIMASYVLLQSDAHPQHRWQQQLLLSGGLKMPTGPSRLMDGSGLVLPAGLQPGTGSWDMLTGVNYTIRQGAWALNTDILARFNTASQNAYRFGNRLSASTRLFYWQKTGKSTLLPHTGALLELANRDVDPAGLTEATGGYAVWGSLGADWIYGHFALGANYLIPIHQYLGTGRTESRQRWNLSINYLF